MRRLLFIALLCLTQAVFAQKKHNDYYLKYSGRFVNDRDSADYIRVVSEPDSGSKYFNVEEYYKNGKLRTKTQSLRIETVVNEGQYLGYFPNGNLKMKAYYVDGYIVGKDYKYYPNGKLYIEDDYGLWNTDKPANEQYRSYHVIMVQDSTGKSLVSNGNGAYSIFNGSDFRYPVESGPVKNGEKDGIWTGHNYIYQVKFTEEYADGKMVRGSAIDSTGGVHQYTQRFVEPQYPGGTKALFKFISSQLEYPQYARDHGKQGRVFIRFMVSKDGTISRISVDKSVHPVLDAEAMRVMALTKTWQPATYCGLPVNWSISIPVSFTLSN